MVLQKFLDKVYLELKSSILHLTHVALIIVKKGLLLMNNIL